MSERENPESGKKEMHEDYSFIKETIKKNPVNLGVHVKRLFTLALGGALFGGSAAVAFTVACPVAAEKFIAGEEVTLSDARPGPIGISAAEETEEAADAEYVEEDVREPEEIPDAVFDDGQEAGNESSMEIYASVYEEAVQIAEKPMKAMVRLSGLSDDTDLLDDSFLTYGEEEGVIFYSDEKDVYILTNYKNIEKSDSIRVTFCKGAVAEGSLCKADPGTGLAVVRVPRNLLTEEEWSEVYVASLSDSFDLSNEKTVIAIGSPSGNFNSVLYGLVTSVSGSLRVADAEYSLLGTNIMGSIESSGVLLDMQGNVIGMIMRTDEDESILKGVSIAELRPLIENLSNGEQIRYLGILGASIKKPQAEKLNIPQGIYVEGVESASPAMIAGIQNGDIIVEINGQETESMMDYMTELQNLNVGEQAELVVCRKGTEGKFVEMEFEMTIEEK